MKLLIMKSSPAFYHILPLRPKYSPQVLVLKHPQPMLFPSCKRPSYTPIQNKGKMVVLHILIL